MTAEVAMTIRSDGPHRGQAVLAAGESLQLARAAAVMLHGRGANAQSILALGDELALPGVAYLAPQAATGSWYPHRFLAPAALNQPWLASALATVEEVVAAVTAAGVPLERTLLLGFSQGACLALEYAARHARRYGGVAGLSGGLIGADDEPRQDHGFLAGTPVFLGCSEVDFHIPRPRVDHAAAVLRRLGGEVVVRLYPGMEHAVNADEIEQVRNMLIALLA